MALQSLTLARVIKLSPNKYPHKLTGSVWPSTDAQVDDVAFAANHTHQWELPDQMMLNLTAVKALG